MKCPYCNEFKGNNGVRGYPVRDQLRRHIQVHHRQENAIIEMGNKISDILQVPVDIQRAIRQSKK